MPDPVNLAELNALRNQMLNQTLSVEQFYTIMKDHGYQYASWARGVAAGDTFSGIAATDYLRGSATIGLGGGDLRNVSDETVNTVVQAMAIGYLDTLIGIAQDGNNVLTRDVTFVETEAFHNAGFAHAGLNIANWTLKTPMDLIRQANGAALVEEIWTSLRDTGGSGLDAFWQNLWLAHRVGALTSSADLSIRNGAQQ